MMNNGVEVTSDRVSSTDGLNIMYTTTPASAQQVCDLDGSHLDEMQQLSSSVVSGDGQLHDSNLLHQHLDNRHPGQDTAVVTAGEPALDETHRSDLNLNTTTGHPAADITANGSHDPTTVHSTHDPNSSFHLELISQTIQLELQESQTSSTSYLE